ncbi:protein FAM216A isoform 1-T2 [Acanthopagrus schlegelii]
MKKQVKFAESQTIHRLHQDEALPRRNKKSKDALNDANMNSNSGLKTSRPAAVRSEPELQHVTTITIPKTMTGAPFLKHSALTPAQKEFLYSIAASSSTTHVRNLITQHYMNVLHRCIRTGDDTVGTSLPETNEGEKHRSEVSSQGKHKEKINTSAKNPGKSFLPKIPNRRARISNTSATKQRSMKKPTTTSPAVRRKRVRIRLLEEEEEEGLTDSLSDCLSSLSVGEWDDDVLSDL